MRERVVRAKTAVAFFHEQLLAAMNHQKVSTSAFTEFYLVNLLAAFVAGRRLPGREPGFDETPLALLYTRALEFSGWERATRLRATADTALFISGVFPESLPRGDLDLGYYASLGEQAYARLGRDHERQAPAATGVFTELASRFREFMDLLGEIGEKTRLSTPASLVRLYERWRQTGSRRSALLLLDQGLAPALADPGLRH
jgi:uncharacterized protein YjiS (DUF1127 family)